MENSLNTFVRMEFGCKIHTPTQYIVTSLERYKPLEKIEERFKIFPKYLEYRIETSIKIIDRLNSFTYYFTHTGYWFDNIIDYRILEFDEWLKENKLYDLI